MPIPIPYTLAPGARAPTRATPGAAGLDLHAYLPDGPAALPPGERAHIPTGVSVAIPAGYEGQIRPRSGLAWKRGVAVLNSPGTIDADYRGELGVILINHGDVECTIYDGDRIAQLVVCPVADAALTPADSLPPTARGAGGFGSTGTGPRLPDAWKHDSGATIQPHPSGSWEYDDRALLEARVRALEAEVAEARAEAAQWAAELDALRAGGAR